MEVVYSEHIKNRLLLRNIDHDLPRQIYELATDRFVDSDTEHLIATMKAELNGKIRDVMVAYVIEDDCAKLLTIHPLKEGQKEGRIETGRWRKL
ncbi:MAG: hypothetical protein HZC51_08475 [Nitrospirae bacterium]|nr:hypothetical protein [Nitrospirota bacterium]